MVIGDSDLLVHQVLGEWATKNTKILPYLYHVQELIKRFTKIEYQNIAIQHPDKNFIDPILVRIHNQLAYCAHVEEETDGKPWFHDIKEYLAKEEYPELASGITKVCQPKRSI